MITDLLEKFYTQLVKTPDGCIVWIGAKNKEGYGYITTKSHGPMTGVHVLAWILKHKREPLGDIHHKCKNKRCTNTDHLEELSRSEHKLLRRTGQE